MSVFAKAVIMPVVFAFLLISFSMFTYSHVITEMNDERYKAAAEDLTKTVAQVIDAEKFVRVRDSVLDIYNKTDVKVVNEEWGTKEWKEYTELYSHIKESEDFKSLLEDIRKIQNVNNVECIYLSVVDSENTAFIYIIDAATDEEKVCPPGSFDPLYEVNSGVLTDPERGFPAYVTDTEEYGWLVTAGAVIHDANGNPVGYAMTDISMEKVRSAHVDGSFKILAVMVSIALAVFALTIIAIRKTFVTPIKKLTGAAREYVRNKAVNVTNVFGELGIKSGDEIEELAEAMQCMEEDINEKIENLLAVNEELTKSRDYANKMALLANTDAMTGAGSKTLYDKKADAIDAEIKEGKKPRFGIIMADLNSLKIINDIYGHTSGNNAIITIYNMLCDAFGKDGVYRIGGDEFVVLLYGSDADNAESIVAEFNENIDAAIKEAAENGEEAVSAALGYAVYDPDTDGSYTDVFTRADNAMYKRKREMKNE